MNYFYQFGFCVLCLLLGTRHFSACVRQTTVDWMMSCAGELRLDREAFQLAVAYFDRYLAIKSPDAFLSRSASGRKTGASQPLPHLQPNGTFELVHEWSENDCPIAVRDKLRRLGATCLWVSSKIVHNPMTCPSSARFAALAQSSSFSRGQMLMAERTLLETLRHRMIVPTSGAFVKAYIARIQSLLGSNAAYETTLRIALSVTDIAQIAYRQLGRPPSLVAAGAITVGISTALNVGSTGRAWKLVEHSLNRFTGFSICDVDDVAISLVQLVNETSKMQQLHCSRLPCLKPVSAAHGWNPSPDELETPTQTLEHEIEGNTNNQVDEFEDATECEHQHEQQRHESEQKQNVYDKLSEAPSHDGGELNREDTNVDKENRPPLEQNKCSTWSVGKQGPQKEEGIETALETRKQSTDNKTLQFNREAGAIRRTSTLRV